MKVLLIEDDVMIGESIQIALDAESIATDWAKSDKEAEEALAASAYDALLLDLGLQNKDGIDILRGLRSRGNNVPVLIVTARDAVSDRILGLKEGADDYLVKPFDLEELIARLHALVRRARGYVDPVYRKGEIVVHLATRQVFLSERQVVLSSREWAILEALVTRPGAVLSRSQLEDRLYGWSGEVESNAIEVYIHGLRKKLGSQFIVNIRGLGYMVEKT